MPIAPFSKSFVKNLKKSAPNPLPNVALAFTMVKDWITFGFPTRHMLPALPIVSVGGFLLHSQKGNHRHEESL